MSNYLPILSSEGSFSRYINEIKRFPILEPEEEYMLAKSWIDHQDRKAAHTLITSHLRLVVSIAMNYKNYGLSIVDIVAEGNIGLMQAVRKFDPDKGFRLATYAMWWIRASIQDYILKSWSLVKIGTTSTQKKLFFNLRKAKKKIEYMEGQSLEPDGHDLSPRHVKEIAEQLNVSETDVLEMNQRLNKDYSLNVIRGDEDSTTEWQDWVMDETPNQEIALVQQNESDYRMHILEQALLTLNEREQDIIKQRFMQDPPTTLEILAERYGISRERVRQIETRAYQKLKDSVRKIQDAMTKIAGSSIHHITDSKSRYRVI